MLKEFREFAMRGNVLDMAVGIIIGAAFGKIVTSFVGDILMPPLGLLLGQMDFSSLFVPLNGESPVLTTGIVSPRHTEHLPTVAFLRTASRALDQRPQIVSDRSVVAA